MFANYLKVALRSLRKHRGYALLNVVGLALGLACFILILLFVRDEWSYDDHLPAADRTYRLAVELEAGEGVQRTAQAPPRWAPLLLDAFPEVEQVVRFKPPRQSWMVRYEDRTFSETAWTFADSSAFDVFGVRLVRGDPATALSAPFTVVVSEAMAAKYFGDEQPIGRTLRIDDQYDFEVTGVMANLPRQSHFHADFLASFVSMEDPTRLYLFNVLEGNFPFAYLYLVLAEGASAHTFADKLPAFLDEHVAPQFRQDGARVEALLQPVTAIHLHSQLENEIAPNGDAATVYIFLAVGLFVLLIACINFMNLATARSAQRAREVGMRKVAGAHRLQLVPQFLAETLVLAFVALGVAVGLVLAALPLFGSLAGKAIGVGALAAPGFVLLVVGATVVTGLLAGSYPAFYLSAFRPAAVLKGDLRRGSGGAARLRKSLIVFQFAISLVLIIGTVVVYRQMDFTQSMALGFDKEHVVVVQVTDPNADAAFPAFREAALQVPGVRGVSASQSVPGGLINQSTVRPAGVAEDVTWQVHTYPADFGYTEALGLDVVAGRALDPAFSTDSSAALVINETAARAFGWHEPEAALGQEILFVGNPNARPRVVGVVADFHSQSARERIAPTVIFFNNFRFFGLVRIAPGDVPGTIAALRAVWERTVPGYAFAYSFLDDDFDRLYQREAVLGTLLGYFTLLTILIACLGLFGLASFTAEQRTKEIGIRKTLGASVSGLVLLLSREFTLLVLAAFVLAAPVAYFAMDRWLGGFAYHAGLAWWIFIAAGGTALVIAWLTVSYQALRAALSNPVDVLRTE